MEFAFKPRLGEGVFVGGMNKLFNCNRILYIYIYLIHDIIEDEVKGGR